MTTIREEMWVKKHFLRPVFYHGFPENMMKTRFQTQSSVVGSARRATTLSSASLRWNARRWDQDDHGDHLHCHQCGVGEVRNMSSPTECQDAPQLHLDYSNPWFVMIDNWIIDAVQWNNIKSRALGALFFAVIGLLMTAVAVAVLWRFWETPVCQNHPAQCVFHLIFNWGCARLWEGTLMCSHLRHLPLILCSKGKKKLLHIFERGRRSKSWSGSQSWGQS